MKKWIYFLIVSVLLVACSKGESDPLTSAPGKPGSITRFTSYGNYLYVLDQNKIVTYDITNASQPNKVHELVDEYGLETITLYEGTIYIGSRNALYILEISNPAAPSILSKSERIGDLAGGCDPVAVRNNYAYSTVKIIENVCGQASVSSRLLVYDVTNKANPVLVDEEAMNIPNGLGYKDNTLFVCDEGADRIFLFDITAPAEPVPFSSFDLVDAVDLIVDGNRMVVSTKTGFSFFDVTNVNSIQPRGHIEIQ